MSSTDYWARYVVGAQRLQPASRLLYLQPPVTSSQWQGWSGCNTEAEDVEERGERGERDDPTITNRARDQLGLVAVRGDSENISLIERIFI